MNSPGGLKPGSCGLQWTDNYTPMQTYYIQHNSLSQPPTTQTHPQSNCTNPGLYQPQATATVAHIILTLAAHAGPVDQENTCTPGIQILHNDPSKISNRLEDDIKRNGFARLFHKQTVFVTGSTGSLGGCLLYKLALQLPNERWVFSESALQNRSSSTEDIFSNLDTVKRSKTARTLNLHLQWRLKGNKEDNFIP